MSPNLYSQDKSDAKQELREQKRATRELKRFERMLADSLLYKATYYNFALLQDLDNRNFENLGWWQFQFDQYKAAALDSFPSTPKDSLRVAYGKKGVVMLVGVLSNIYELEANRPPAYRDLPALVFLLMLRTIANPKDYIAYLSVIAYSSKMEDYGTALFYLEALLENDFQDFALLSKLPETGLLRIMPEYQALIEVYLKKGRYGIREEVIE